MEDKEHKINIDIEITITDSETGEVIVPKEKPINPFFKVPWGWICIGCVAFFLLSVKHLDFLPFHEYIGCAAFFGTFISSVFFGFKLADKDEREGGYVGGDYPYLGI